MNVHRGEIDVFKTAFVLQNPFKIHLDYWYNKEANEVVMVKNEKGIISITVPLIGRQGIEAMLPREAEFLAQVKEGETILFDNRTNDIIYRSKPGWKDGVTGYTPKISKVAADNFVAYLAGDYSGNFVSMYGTNRNLVLTLYAQSHSLLLRGGTEQTVFGRYLATGLILRRSGLPSLDEPKNITMQHFQSSIKTDSLPEDCFKALDDLNTSLPVGGIMYPELPAPKDDKYDIYLEDFLRAGIMGCFDDDGRLDFPILMNFRGCLFNHGWKNSDVAFIDSISLEDVNIVNIVAHNTTQKMLDELEALFTGLTVWVRDGANTIMLKG
jgi:hypothetical protein